MKTNDPKKLLRILIDPVLQKPGAGIINFADGFLSYHANAEDMPRIIGKGGLNIISLKQVIEIPGVRLTIIEPGHRVTPPPPTPLSRAWNPEGVKRLIEAALGWRGYDQRVHVYSEADHWKIVMMETAIETRFREGLTTWAQVAAFSTGGRIIFEQDTHAILQTI